MSDIRAEAKLTLSFLKLLQQTGQIQGFDSCREPASGSWSHTKDGDVEHWVRVTSYYSVMGR